jgi:hypothetical protein
MKRCSDLVTSLEIATRDSYGLGAWTVYKVHMEEVSGGFLEASR